MEAPVAALKADPLSPGRGPAHMKKDPFFRQRRRLPRGIHNPVWQGFEEVG